MTVRTPAARPSTGRADLETVVATRARRAGPGHRRPGPPRRGGPRLAAELSATAALIELARSSAAGRTHARSRSSRPAAAAAAPPGPRDWRPPPEGAAPDAVIVLGDVGLRARRAGRGCCRGRAARGIAPDAPAAHGRAAAAPGGRRATRAARARWRQLARLALPVRPARRAPFNAARGPPAVVLQASGERGPAAGAPCRGGPAARLRPRGAAHGHALDNGPATCRGRPEAPTSSCSARSCPPWVVRLLVGALLLAAAARRGRRRGPRAAAQGARRRRGCGGSLALAVPFAAPPRWRGSWASTGLLRPAPPGAVPRRARRRRRRRACAIVAAGLRARLRWPAARCSRALAARGRPGGARRRGAALALV